MPTITALRQTRRAVSGYMLTELLFIIASMSALALGIAALLVARGDVALVLFSLGASLVGARWALR